MPPPGRSSKTSEISRDLPLLLCSLFLRRRSFRLRRRSLQEPPLLRVSTIGETSVQPARQLARPFRPHRRPRTRSQFLEFHNGCSVFTLARASLLLTDRSLFSAVLQVDLVGGYYDAGDHVKFGLPMAFTITMLSWSVIEYRREIESAGELEHAFEAIKWGTDYFIKAHTSPNVLWAEVRISFSIYHNFVIIFIIESNHIPLTENQSE